MSPRLYLIRRELNKNMYKLDISDSQFKKCITAAISELRSRNLKPAYEEIVEAMHLYPDAPQPHNLLGIWFELKGNGLMARRHYRAAYSLDPTFQPACKNIERICSFENFNSYEFYFGDEQEK